jgi:hypothetical protein
VLCSLRSADPQHGLTVPDAVKFISCISDKPCTIVHRLLSRLQLSRTSNGAGKVHINGARDRGQKVNLRLLQQTTGRISENETRENVHRQLSIFCYVLEIWHSSRVIVLDVATSESNALSSSTLHRNVGILDINISVSSEIPPFVIIF